jgi:hypothetical protein
MLMPQDSSPDQALTPAAKAALEKLSDIAVPAPVSWAPQTWGWVAVAAALLVLAVWLVVCSIRRRIANRYRVEALADLAALEAQLDDRKRRPAALAAIPPLVKRVALAVWPRPEVAALSGQAWTEFLRGHAGRDGLPEAAAKFLWDGEYQPATLATMSAADARGIVGDIKRWIEGHRVRS